MTLNIGSSKISRLAIGQADGSVKNIVQLNLGENVIFKKQIGSYFPLPTEIDENSFYFGMPNYEEDKALYGTPAYFRIYNPLESSSATATLNIWYTKPYNRTPDFTTTIKPNTNKNIHDDSNFHFDYLTKDTLIQMKFNSSDVFPYYYSNPSDGAIIRLCNNGQTQLYRVVLSSMPSLDKFHSTINPTTYFGSPFKGFNMRGSIYDINDGCFEMPNNFIRMEANAFVDFNSNGGLLHRIPVNSFNFQNITSNITNLSTFNGTTSKPGHLTTNLITPTSSYNQVMVNKYSQAVTITNADGRTISVPVGSAFEWNSAS